MRAARQELSFQKMESCGNDYIYIDNRDGAVASPESLCVGLCDRHYGIGSDGIVLIERSARADARMRMFNSDGSEGEMAGNCVRCVAKFLYDNGIAAREELFIESASGLHHCKLYISGGRVSSVCVDMGRASLSPPRSPFS